MISLKINNSTLDLNGRESEIRFKFKSSFFGMASSLVLDITVPLSDENRRLLGFIDRPNRQTRTRQTLSVSLYSGNGFIAEGTGKTGKISEKEVELNINFIFDEVEAALDNKKLATIMAEEFAFTKTYFTETIEKNYPETPVNFPCIYNPEFYGSVNPAFLGVINNVEETLVDDVFNVNTIVPQVYLAYIVQQLFNYCGYKLIGEILDDEMYQKALVYNNYAIDKVVAILFYGEKENELNDGYLIDWNLNLINPGGYYNTSTHKYNIQVTGKYTIKGQVTHESVFVPGLDANFTLQLIYNVSGLETVIYEDPGTLAGGHINTVISDIDVEHTALVAGSNSYYIKLTYYDKGVPEAGYIVSGNIEIKNVDNPFANAYLDSFNLKNHVPDMECIPFLNAFFSDFKVAPVIDNLNKVVKLVSWSDFLKQNPERNYADKLIVDSMKIEESDYEGLKLKFNFLGPDSLLNNNLFTPDNIAGTITNYWDIESKEPGTVWKLESMNVYLSTVFNEDTLAWDVIVLSDIHPDKIYGSGIDPIELNFAPLLMRNVPNRNSYGRFMPSISATGTSEARGLFNEFPLRIMFYVGYGGALTSENYYAIASTTAKDLVNETVLPMNWTVDEVIARYWSEFIKFRQNRLPFEARFQLTDADLGSIDLSKLIFSYDVYLLAEEIYVRPDENGGEAEITGFLT